MGDLIRQSWDVLIRVPEGQLEPKLRDELVGYGPEITPVQIAVVLQKCVRYGASSDFVVNLLDLFLRDAVDQSASHYQAMLTEASDRLTREET